MQNIHDTCAHFGRSDGRIDYKRGANIAAFRELSKAISLYGIR